MEQNHAVLMSAEEDAGDPAAWKGRAYLPQALAALDGPAERHAYRPAELCRSNIIANRLAVFWAKLKEPVSNRNPACVGLEKPGRKALSIIHSGYVP